MISKLTEIAAALARSAKKAVGESIKSASVARSCCALGRLEPAFRVLFSAIFHGVPLENSIRVAICGKECNQNVVLSRALFICRFGAGALGPAKRKCCNFGGLT